MNKIGLIVTINKFKYYFETSQTTFSCDSIDDAKDKLVEHLAREFATMKIDFPLDLTDFENEWFDKKYVNTNAFYYQLFMEGNWHEPWDQQDIYLEVLDKMLQEEYNNLPNFEEIYGEPDPDEEIIDKFPMESEKIHEFEKKLTEIIKNAKDIHFKEDSVKECKCDKCFPMDV